ncbi:unnamed protein product [Blepharisma stoltei]|uniref:PIH1D1/2/3 CS-like domain-containing protein n=1 Tax=Blepharisma stoltei TaxID=1481888 RepID=A0AAU9JP67_9CILI|nr:unnamed protein product [Blepharisma stoltei]
MDFNPSNIEALKDLLCGDEDEQSPYSNFSSGSALNPGVIGGGQKEMAPPNAKIEAKVNRPSKNDIWQAEEVNNVQAEKSDDRPEPEYEILYQQRVGTEDVYLGLSDLDTSSRQCQDLILKIKLPNTRFKDIGLDVDPQTVRLQAPNYKLTLPLPHAVLDKQGSAKWETNKDLLTVNLPIDKNDIPL